MEESKFLRALTAPPCQAVIAALKASDALTVAELRAQTRMSAPALSRTVGQLMRLGLVEQNALGSSGGRPAHRYSLRGEALGRLYAAVRQLQSEVGASE